MRIQKEESYRSDPLLNMTDDSVRVTLLLKNWEWRLIKELLKDNVWEEMGQDGGCD